MPFARPRYCLGVAACASLATLLLTGCPNKKKDTEESDKPAATAAAAKPAAPATKLIKVNRRAEGKASYISLKTVELTAKATTLSMAIKNDGPKKLDGLRVSPPGAPDAFYIMSPDKKRYDLRSTSGLTVSPKTTDLEPGQGVEFTLVFEPLDPNMDEFDLLEGANQDPNSTYWNFKGVKLK